MKKQVESKKDRPKATVKGISNTSLLSKLLGHGKES